jgi:hypothetical protein
VGRGSLRRGFLLAGICSSCGGGGDILRRRWRHNYCFLQPNVFVFYPCTRTSSRLGDARIQGNTPSLFTLRLCSTRNERGNCNPFIVCFYPCFLLHVFVTTLVCFVSSSSTQRPVIPVTPEFDWVSITGPAFASSLSVAGEGIPAGTSDAVSLSAYSGIVERTRASSRRGSTSLSVGMEVSV